MEILFQNNHVRDKKLAKEVYRYYYFERTHIVVLYILLFISFLSSVLLSIYENECNWGILIVFPLLMFFIIFSYCKQVNTMVKRDEEVYGKAITVEAIVTEDFIQNTASTGAVNKLEFSKVRNAVQTKNLILLRTKANLIYVFRKDSFTKGTKEEFIVFLRGKGIKI